MDYFKAKKQYLEDPQFKKIADTLMHLIYENKITPYEVRDIANFVMTRWQMENMDHSIFVSDKIKYWEVEDE